MRLRLSSGNIIICPMELISINPSHPEPELIERAARAILSGQVIGYPTETVYGLGADAFNAKAIDRVFQLKGRDRSRPILVIAGDMTQVKRMVQWSDLAEHLAQQFWPGPLTLVLPAMPGLPEALLSADQTLGIRIPNHNICLELVRRCGVPVTSTSANRSGQPNPVTARDVVDYFGDQLDLVIDGGRSSSAIPSTVLGISGDRLILFREGAISKSTIEHSIHLTVHER